MVSFSYSWLEIKSGWATHLLVLGTNHIFRLESLLDEVFERLRRLNLPFSSLLRCLELMQTIRTLCSRPSCFFPISLSSETEFRASFSLISSTNFTSSDIVFCFSYVNRLHVVLVSLLKAFSWRCLCVKQNLTLSVFFLVRRNRKNDWKGWLHRSGWFHALERWGWCVPQ